MCTRRNSAEGAQACSKVKEILIQQDPTTSVNLVLKTRNPGIVAGLSAAEHPTMIIWFGANDFYQERQRKEEEKENHHP
uniref:Uncharacterized protein n=1 Tax=Romanomermis culicivorax TaxID=13658 RepID=A0A915KKD7_ROMCU